MKSLLLYILLTCFHTTIAQLNGPNPYAVSFSLYADNAIHPGLKLSGYYDFWINEKSKERLFEKRQEKKGNMVRQKSLFGKVEIGFYNHPNNHLGWLGNIGLGYERMNSRNGWLSGVSLNVGYLYRDYTFETFTLQDNTINKIPLAGSRGLVYSLSLFYGRDFSVKNCFPIKLRLKPSIQVMAYTYSYVINSALAIEFIYHF